VGRPAVCSCRVDLDGVGHAAGMAVPARSGPARSTRPWWSAAARGGGTLARWAARANRIERAAPGGGANPGPLAPAVSGPDADRFSTLTVTALVEILLRGPDLSMGTSAGPGCHRRPVRGVGSRRVRAGWEFRHRGCGTDQMPDAQKGSIRPR
jgi:hypothetical protein